MAAAGRTKVHVSVWVSWGLLVDGQWCRGPTSSGKQEEAIGGYCILEIQGVNYR